MRSALALAASSALSAVTGLIKPERPALFIPANDSNVARYAGRFRTIDQFQTLDAATADSTGAFLVGQLEKLDPQMNAPLVSVTWSRDIDLREDVGIGDETASWTNSTFAGAGGLNPNGKNWIGKDSTAIATMALDIAKTPQPLYLWGTEIGWTIPELASAQTLNRPVDVEKFDALNLKHQMDIDEQVYIGDATLGLYGLLNSPAVTSGNVVAGASASTHWSQKTPDEILADVNTVLNTAWLASGYAVVPRELRLPPAQYSLITAAKVSTAGNLSILSYLKENSLAMNVNGVALNIQPIKWLTGRGASGVDRMMAYTKDPKRVRYPLVPLQRTQPEWRGIWQMVTYFGRLGVVEMRYPETLYYADGI